MRYDIYTHIYIYIYVIRQLKVNSVNNQTANCCFVTFCCVNEMLSVRKEISVG